MANIKSAKKRILVIETKTARNKAIKSKVKTYVKKVETAVEKKDVEAAKAALKEAISVINKAGTGCLWRKFKFVRQRSFFKRIIIRQGIQDRYLPAA